MDTAVVALGGNALLQHDETPSIEAQFANARRAAKTIQTLSEQYRIVVTHGNGPQVGNILIRSEEALGKAYPISLNMAVAESEGEIGYILQQVLQNTLHRTVVSLLTQVRVDEDDPAFDRPTKPIGPSYTADEATALTEKGLTLTETAHGHRRVVPSPVPREIIEADAIRDLLAAGFITIAAGGGGIPVTETADGLEDVDAVIDKDLASACLAKSVGADALFLLTDVPCIYRKYDTPEQEPIKHMTVEEARSALERGDFPEGSMRPKVEAAAQFLTEHPDGRAIIGGLEDPYKGTEITAE